MQEHIQTYKEAKLKQFGAKQFPKTQQVFQ